MADDFPLILKELDELCNSSKYVRVFSDPTHFLNIVEEAFSVFTNQGNETPIEKANIELGLAHSILQKLIGDCSEVTEAEVSDVVASRVSSSLLSSCLSRIRQNESDHSLAHMIERFSKEDSGDFAESFADILRMGENAPDHESLLLLLLAVKVALCHLDKDVEVGGVGEALSKLSKWRVLQAPQVVNHVRREVNKAKVALLSAPFSLVSVGGISPKIINSESVDNGEKVCSVVAHGELGVVALIDAFKGMHNNPDSQNISFTIRVQCSGAFQVGWAHAGLEFNENFDLRRLDGCCVYDGFSLWCEKSETPAVSPRKWQEYDIVTCTLDREKQEFVFSRNGCENRVTIPGNEMRWRPVLSLVKDEELLGKVAGMYPSVCESMFHRCLYVEPQAVKTWTWGKGSKGVQAENGVASTSSLSQSIVLGNAVLATGVHTWELSLSGELNEVKIGAASEDILNCLDKVSSCKEVYLWTYGEDCGRFTQSGRRKKSESIPSFKTGDKVQIEVDIVRGKITFAKNGVIMKMIHDIRSCGWVPIAYFSSGAKIELSKKHHFKSMKQESSRSSRRKQSKMDLSTNKRNYSINSRFCLNPIMERCVALTSTKGVEIKPASSCEEVKGKDGVFSLSMWVRLDPEQVTDSTLPWLSLLLKGNDHTSCRMPGLFVRTKDLKLALCLTTCEDWNTTIRSSQPLELNKWTHIAVTYHDKVCLLYVNGNVEASHEMSTPPLFNDEPWYIGKCPSGVKKACAEYPGVSGHVSSLHYSPSRPLDSSDVFLLSACPPTVAVDLCEGLVRPATRLRLGLDGRVTIMSQRLPNSFTLEALVVAKSLSEKQNSLLSQGDASSGGFDFGVTQSGALYLNLFKREVFYGKDNFIVPGRLFHLAVVYGRSEICFYVDGFAAGVCRLSQEMIDVPFSPLMVGAAHKGWNGDVLDVRVWHESRSQLQISESGMSRKPPVPYQSKVFKGKIPRCSNDHSLTITSEGLSNECRDCKMSGKGERWWCEPCREYVCFKCRGDCRATVMVEPVHWLRFTEGIGSSVYDTWMPATSRVRGTISGTFQWMSTPLLEEEEMELEVTTVQDPDTSTTTSLKEFPTLLLGELAQVAKSFEVADMLEQGGLGVGVKVKAPRQAVFPFVTTFNLLYSIIGQLHEEGNAFALISALSLLASNLYAVKSSHFVDQLKTGLGVTGKRPSFCERLLNRVREVAAKPPVEHEKAVLEACARVIAVGITTFCPTNNSRRSFISKLVLEETTPGSRLQVEHICKLICGDMSQVCGLVCEEAGPSTDASLETTPLDLLKHLLAYTRKSGDSGETTRLLLLLQQVLIGIVPSQRHIQQNSTKKLPKAPVLHLMNSLTEQSMCRPMEKELRESTVRLLFQGESLLKVDGGTVTYEKSKRSESTEDTWISITAQECLFPNTGTHTLYFCVKVASDSKVCVGLAGDEHNSKEQLGKCRQSIGWHLGKGEVHCLKRSSSSTSHKVSVKNEHLVSLKVDTCSDTPSIILRDEETCQEMMLTEMGPALERLFASGPVYPAVSLCQTGQSVTFLRRVAGEAKSCIPTDSLMTIEANKDLLVPYCEELFKISLDELNELIKNREEGLEYRRPVILLTKAMCSSLFISPLSYLPEMTEKLDVRLLLRAAESLREMLNEAKQFQHMEDLEELIIILALLGVGEASRLISGCSSGGDNVNGDAVKQEERSDKLLEAGFKVITSESEDDELLKFMSELQAGTGLAAGLRSCIVDHIGARPFKQLAAQGEEIANSMHCLTAAMLYHAGALPVAFETAKKIKSIKESGEEDVLEKLGEMKWNKVLVKVWECEKAMRMWCRQQKTGKKIDYPTQALILEAKLEFLMDLMPRLGEDYSEGDSSAQHAVIDQVAKFAKSDEDVEELRSIMTLSMERAKQRERGLIAAKELLRFDSLPLSARAAIMSRFKLFRVSTSDALHYLDDLHSSGISARLAVKTSFDSLFMRMGKELENAVESGDIELQLVVLNSWGLRLKPEDHSLLSHARLFDTLHLILQQEEDAVLDTPARIQRLKLLKKAALKLVVLLATQVATQGEIGKPNVNELLPPMMPIALKKQNSGSGTFTDSVFQLLHQELFASLSVLKSQSRTRTSASSTGETVSAPILFACGSSGDSTKKVSKKSKSKTKKGKR